MENVDLKTKQYIYHLKKIVDYCRRKAVNCSEFRVNIDAKQFTVCQNKEIFLDHSLDAGKE